MYSKRLLDIIVNKFWHEPRNLLGVFRGLHPQKRIADVGKLSKRIVTLRFDKRLKLRQQINSLEKELADERNDPLGDVADVGAGLKGNIGRLQRNGRWAYQRRMVLRSQGVRLHGLSLRYREHPTGDTGSVCKRSLSGRKICRRVISWQ